MFEDSENNRSAAPPRSIRTEPPASDSKRFGPPRTRRRTWASVALVMSLLAIGVEGCFHLCASLLFDPLPDFITGVAYAWILFSLCFNEATIHAAEQPSANPLILWLGPKRAAGVAIATTGVALLAAAMTAWIFLPFLALAPLLVLSLIGLLLLVPCLDLLVLIAQFRALRFLWQHETAEPWDRRAVVGTAFLGVAAVFFLIVRPVLIGRLTAQALHRTGDSQQQAFSGLRILHGESAMLDLTYTRKPPYWVCVGGNAGKSGLWPWVGYGWDTLADDIPAARRTYFLLTGTPFESVPRPDSEAHQNFLGDVDNVAAEETGGSVVGRPVPGLCLDSSALQFTADAQTESTTGAWTLVFRNETNAPQEARADILLPPGGACSQVSLWINGVERPAALSAPQKVRESYQQIAVVQHRDPLLVTMPAPDHLLAQCFPVPAGATMKIKLGITAPLTWRSGLPDGSESRLLWICPALGSVNFEVPSRLTHSLTLATATGYPIAAPIVRGADIFSPPAPQVPSVRNEPRIGDSLGPGVTRTEPAIPDASAPVDLWLVRDASRGMNNLLTPAMQGELRHALLSLPIGSRVVTEDTAGKTDPDASPNYAGGTDPAPVLEEALRRARESRSSGRAAAVLFLHAASSAWVSDLSGLRHELQLGAGGAGPALITVQLAPRAPDAVAMDLAGFSAVYDRRALPGDGPGALGDAVRLAAWAASAAGRDSATPLGGHSPAVNGIVFAASSTGVSDREALADLRQVSLTTDGWYRSNAADDPAASLALRIAVGAPAARAHLVTPISSAVVLETREEYEANGLKDPERQKTKEADKPKPDLQNADAPEPAAGPLALLGICLLTGFKGSARRRIRVRAGG